jgi:hypothetical protein
MDGLTVINAIRISPRFSKLNNNTEANNMKFHKAPDTADLFLRVVDETNTIQVGIYKVLFGYRVRAGYVDDKFGVNLDWCCGNRIEMINWLYLALILILSKRELENCFEGLPTVSQIKPYFNDMNFFNKIIDCCKGGGLPYEFKFTQEDLDARN